MTGGAERTGSRLRRLRARLAGGHLIRRVVSRLLGFPAEFADLVRASQSQLWVVRHKRRGAVVVCVDVSESSFVVHVEPLVAGLLNGFDRRVAIVVSAGPGATQMPAAWVGDPRVHVARKSASNLIRGIAVYVSAWNGSRGPKGSYAIHVTHGQPAKYWSYVPGDLSYFDEWFVIGPVHERHTLRSLDAAGLTTESQPLLTPIGLPKSDPLLNGHHHRDQMLAGLGLDPGLFTVLFAPSWEQQGCLRSSTLGRDVLRSIAAQHMNLVIRLHPVSYVEANHPLNDLFTGGTDWKAEIGRQVAGSRVVHVTTPGYSIEPLLAAADCLVTDFSSVALDFLALNKPVVFLDCPGFASLVRSNSGLGSAGLDDAELVADLSVNAGRDYGYLARSAPEAAEVIAEWSTSSPCAAEPHPDLRQQLYFNPGKAREVAVQRIRDLVRAQVSPQPD